MKGFKFLLDHWMDFFFISLLLLGGIKTLESLDDETFNNMFYQNKTLPQLSGELIVSSAAFNGVTPAYRYESGIVKGIFNERYIVGINDIPYFDGSDLLILAPVLFLLTLIFKSFQLNKNPIYDAILRLLVITILMIIAFLILKNIEYSLYIDYTQRLTGLDKESIIMARENVLLSMEETKGLFALISIIGGAGILLKMKK